MIKWNFKSNRWFSGLFAFCDFGANITSIARCKSERNTNANHAGPCICDHPGEHALSRLISVFSKGGEFSCKPISWMLFFLPPWQRRVIFQPEVLQTRQFIDLKKCGCIKKIMFFTHQLRYINLPAFQQTSQRSPFECQNILFHRPGRCFNEKLGEPQIDTEGRWISHQEHLYF